jgi:hypothetical protein
MMHYLKAIDTAGIDTARTDEAQVVTRERAANTFWPPTVTFRVVHGI